jgi:hypothetical protein
MITNENTIESLGGYKAGIKDIFFHKSKAVLKAILGFSVLLLFYCPFISTHATAETVFKSGFEKGVTMSNFLKGGDNWKKKIYGSDQGYDWGADLPGGSANHWNLILNRYAFPNPSECLELNIDSTRAHNGSRSLHMEVKKQCKNDGITPRISYNPTMGTWPYDETHIKYWLRLPSKIKTYTKSIILNEIFLGDADLRIAFNIKKDVGGPLRFGVWADDIKSGWNPHWEKKSDYPVPIDKWFQVEIYFKCKTYAEGGGAYWIKINGTKILEVKPTRYKRICGASVKSSTCKNPSDWNLIKFYTFGNDIEAWLDDFRIYNTLTATSVSNQQHIEPPTGLKVLQ